MKKNMKSVCAYTSLNCFSVYQKHSIVDYSSKNKEEKIPSAVDTTWKLTKDPWELAWKWLVPSHTPTPSLLNPEVLALPDPWLGF